MGKRSRKKEVCSRWEGLGKENKAGGAIEEDTLRKQREGEMEEEEKGAEGRRDTLGERLNKRKRRRQKMPEDD